MNGPLLTLPLDSVAVGAKLALDVCDAAGHVLLAAGAELGEASLASLRQRGVSQVTIAEPLSETELAELRVEVVQRLERLFRKSAGDPVMRTLHDAVLAYRLEELR